MEICIDLFLIKYGKNIGSYHRFSQRLFLSTCIMLLAIVGVYLCCCNEHLAHMVSNKFESWVNGGNAAYIAVYQCTFFFFLSF